MSSLDLSVDRMISLRARLDHAAQVAADLNWPIFELGLGSGRSYHDMCQLFPEGEIFVFERDVASHPNSTLPETQVFLGEVVVSSDRMCLRSLIELPLPECAVTGRCFI